MKLSDAMMLGDTLRKRRWDIFLNVIDPKCPEGCALGGAQLAMGRTDSYAFEELWPWLKEPSAPFPSLSWRTLIGCSVSRDTPSFVRVMREECTFEQLVDYVRSIEPPEEPTQETDEVPVNECQHETSAH